MWTCLDVYLGVELLSHIISLCLTIGGTARFFQRDIPTSSVTSVSVFFLPPYQHMLLPDSDYRCPSGYGVVPP